MENLGTFEICSSGWLRNLRLLSHIWSHFPSCGGHLSPCTWVLKGAAKNTESLTGTMPGTTLHDNFLLSATRALASSAAHEQMEAGTSEASLLLGFLKASCIRHNRSQDNGAVSRSVFFPGTWYFTRGRSKGHDGLCRGRVWRFGWRLRECQADTDRLFPIHAGGRRHCPVATLFHMLKLKEQISCDFMCKGENLYFW